MHIVYNKLPQMLYTSIRVAALWRWPKYIAETCSSIV